ncbi:hypothetical protein V6N13_091567 [Hibiscus sabdariffa]
MALEASLSIPKLTNLNRFPPLLSFFAMNAQFTSPCLANKYHNPFHCILLGIFSMNMVIPKPQSRLRPLYSSIVYLHTLNDVLRVDDYIWWKLISRYDYLWQMGNQGMIFKVKQSMI